MSEAFFGSGLHDVRAVGLLDLVARPGNSDLQPTVSQPTEHRMMHPKKKTPEPAPKTRPPPRVEQQVQDLHKIAVEHMACFIFVENYR